MATILVVDDEANIRDVVQYALEREGFEISSGAVETVRIDTNGWHRADGSAYASLEKLIAALK